MHHGFALRYIPQIMQWTPKQENDETIWLRSVSEYKYNEYQDFPVGSRFAEALLDWLRQFDAEHRELAYQLVRNNLVFLSFPEMQHLVRRAFPAFIRPLQASRAARKLSIPEYMIWADKDSAKLVNAINDRSLFVGLSDGARLDSFRRANVGIISNEQFILFYEISPEKWIDMLKELEKRTGEKGAKFEFLVLLDDFAGSGKTLIRWDNEKKKWSGKLSKISNWLEDHKDGFSDDCDVLVHHYVGTERAQQGIDDTLKAVKTEGALARLFAGNLFLRFDLILSNSIALTPGINSTLDAFVRKYYDPNIMTPSLRVGGDDVMHGFARCGLPLVMEHNTPNNSLGIFWAESPVSATPPPHLMRPLFRRRQRHN